MFPGETILSGANPVCECGVKFEFEVMESGAGYYIGTRCKNPDCPDAFIPNSRETGYFHSCHSAEQALLTYLQTGYLEKMRR